MTIRASYDGVPMLQSATIFKSEEPDEFAGLRSLHETGTLLTFVSANPSAELYADAIHRVAVVRWLDRTPNEHLYKTLSDLRVLMQDLATTILLHDGRTAPMDSSKGGFVEAVTRELLLRNLVSDWVIVHPVVLPTQIHHMFAKTCLESGTALHTVANIGRAYQRIARLPPREPSLKATQLADNDFVLRESNYTGAIFVSDTTHAVLFALTGYEDPVQLTQLYELVRELSASYKSLICDCRNLVSPSLEMVVRYVLDELPLLFGPNRFDRLVQVHYDDSIFEHFGIDIEGFVELHGKMYSTATSWPDAFGLTRMVYAATRGTTLE